MRYKKIEILNSQDEFISRDELDKKLEEYYGYPLLNFAFVIADVFAENSVFNPTFPFGKKRSDIKREIAELGEIKSEIIKLVEKYFLKFYSPDSVRVLSKLNPEKIEKFYISWFKLKPSFNNIDDSIKRLEEMYNLRNIHPPVATQSLVTDAVITQALITQGFWPFFKKHRRSFSIANQVSFLWSPVLRDKNWIHWGNICNLICWFLENLEGSTYESKLDFPHGKEEEAIGGNINVLKNQYRRIKKPYSTLISTSSDQYFPHKNNRPEKPYLFSNPVISVKFYHNKIKAIYKEKDILKVRQTLLKPDRKEHEIREYKKDEEKKETSCQLLEIV